MTEIEASTLAGKMKQYRKRKARAAVSLVSCAIALLSGISARGAVWESADDKDPVADVLMLKDGSACILFGRRGPNRLVPGNATPQSMGLETTESASFLRVFHGRQDADLFVVGVMNGNPCFWARRGGKWKLEARVQDSPDRPLCYQGKDGTIWLHSWDGVVFRFAEGKAERYDYAPRIDKSRGSYTHYQSLRIAESDKGMLAFIAHFGSKLQGKAMKHILLRRDKDWDTLPMSKMHPGGVCFTSETNLLVATENGLVEFDLDGGDEPVRTIPIPGDSALFETPVFLKKLPNGVLVTLWTKQRSGWSGAPAYADGSFSRLAEYDGKQWKIVDLIGDNASWDFFRSVRPSVVDADGNFWVGVAGGVLCRERDGSWKRFGWRHGFSLPTPIRLVPGKGRTMWMVDKSGSCLAIETGKTTDDDEKDTPWSEISVRGELKRGPDGYLYGVSDQKGGSVLKIGEKGLEYNALPADLGFRVERLYYMSFDSEGGMWLFSGISDKKTAYFDGSEWSVYVPQKGTDLRYHDKELAFQSQLGRGEKFRIGDPRDQYYVQYTADGRILYQNEWRRACYFDGKMWHAPYGANEVGSSGLSDHPFFHEGKVTIHVSGKCYQMENDAWSKQVDDRSGRAWKEVGAIPHPFSKKEAKQRQKVVIADSCPTPLSKRRWTLKGAGWTWVGSEREIVCSPSGTWLTMSTEGSPMKSVKRVSRVLSAPGGRWVFELEGGRPRKYVVYQSGALEIAEGQRNLGHVDRPFSRITIPWRTRREREDLVMRYRVDSGEWTGLLPVDDFELGVIAGKGQHTLSFELFGRRELLRGPGLNYSLQVAYNSETLIEALIDSLGARTWKEREQATQDLIRFGKRALPQMRQAQVIDDPEVSSRLKRIILEVEKPRAKAS
jgi:hypothetical protein